MIKTGNLTLIQYYLISLFELDNHYNIVLHSIFVSTPTSTSGIKSVLGAVTVEIHVQLPVLAEHAMKSQVPVSSSWRQRKVWRREEVLGVGEKRGQLTTNDGVTKKGKDIQPVSLPTPHIPGKR